MEGVRWDGGREGDEGRQRGGREKILIVPWSIM